MIRCRDSSGVGQPCCLHYLESTQMQSEDTHSTRATQTGLRNAAEPFFPAQTDTVRVGTFSFTPNSEEFPRELLVKNCEKVVPACCSSRGTVHRAKVDLDLNGLLYYTGTFPLICCC